MAFNLNEEPLERAAARAGELFISLFRDLETRRVDPGLSAEEFLPRFRDTLADEGVGLLAALDDFREQIIPASMATPHPMYFGLVNCSPLPAAALADLLVSSLNNNNGAFGQGPAAAAAEQELLRSFSNLCYGHENATGMILPGGSIANLQGLLLARTRHFPDWDREGPLAVKRQPILYTSEVSHFSVLRAAKAMGLGETCVAAIPAQGRGAMDADALARRIRSDQDENREPFAVVATAGTTGTGAIDPLEDIASLCKEHRLWMHVDACYGGAALLLDKLMPRFAGLERADSIALDPHKWFFAPLTTSLILVKDPEIEHQCFDIKASYIPHRESMDSFRRGLPTSRRASPLTLWMALRAHGWNAVREAVRENIRLTRILEIVLEQAGFTVLPDGELSMACARFEPADWSAETTDQLQADIAHALVASGETWFATLQHDGKIWMRFNLLNLYTKERHIKKLVRLVARAAKKLSEAT